mgnify:CR=1 FL=1
MDWSLQAVSFMDPCDWVQVTHTFPKSFSSAPYVFSVVESSDTDIASTAAAWVWGGGGKNSLRFEIGLNFSKNPRKLSIFFRSFSNRSEALGRTEYHDIILSDGTLGDKA